MKTQKQTTLQISCTYSPNKPSSGIISYIMQKAPPTPKGFRDILPEKAAKRRVVLNAIADVLEKEGFLPLETPTVEFAETLTGKYGEEEKLIYKFKDRGDRELALRYDLTVPLARFVANNQNLLAKGPFRRYQIGQVFRGENPQAGRYREFTQFDFDIVGFRGAGFEEESTVIKAAIESINKLGLNGARMLINDRFVFKNLKPEFVRAIDKMQKIGKDNVIKELVNNGAEVGWATKYINTFDKTLPTPNIKTLFGNLKEKKLIEANHFEFDPTLARGLDYYTGSIFELKPDNNPASLSIGAGGRYDNLIGTFAGRQIPAVGFSFGLDRIVDLL